jgi:hypothetical protein
MSDDQVIALVRENERLKGALRACRSFAEHSVFGGWRHKIASICDTALRGRA